jgi:hypothetical protein
VARDKYDVWLDPDVNDFDVIRDIFKPLRREVDASVYSQQELSNSRIDDAESATLVTLDTPIQARLF